MKFVGLALTLASVALAVMVSACNDDDDDAGAGGSSGSDGAPGGSGGAIGGTGAIGGAGAGGSPSFDVDCETLCENVVECAASTGMAGAGGAGSIDPDPSECVSSCEFSVRTLPTELCAAELAEFLECSVTVESDATSCIDGMLRHELICTDEFDAVVACQGG